MATSTTLTVRLPEKVKRQLGKLAQSTQRTKSFLAGEAIAGYVDRELEIIEGIKRGRADVKAGRLVPHLQAMDELDGAIQKTIARKRK